MGSSVGQSCVFLSLWESTPDSDTTADLEHDIRDRLHVIDGPFR